MRYDSTAFTFLNFIIFIFITKFKIKIAILRTITKNLIKKFHKKILIKYEKFKRVEVSVFIQLRTKKIVLQNYLHDIKMLNIKHCQCDNVENKMHVLLQYFKWTSLKNKYFKIERNLWKLLNNNAFIKKIIMFIFNMKLFSQFRFVKTSTHVFDEKNKENQSSNNTAMNF